MKVKFYSLFIKKFNSTKVPSNSDSSVQIDGEIKGDFSPLAPVIRFQGTSFPATSVPAYRYAYIAAFSRYYFVSWAFIDGAWEGSFKCDVLGSFSAQIKNSTQFVARSASNMNGGLIDPAYATRLSFDSTDYDVQSKALTDIFGVNYAGGTYVMGVIGAAATTYLGQTYARNIGAVVYYAMGRDAFTALMASLLSSVNWLNIDASEISENLQKALINPAQYIVSCVWLPIPSAAFVDGTGQGWGQETLADISQSINFGWWTFNLGYNTRKLGFPTAQADNWHVSFDFPIVRHPDGATFGSWVYLSPYSRYVLSLPCFGLYELDTTKLTGNLLTVDYYIHPFNGDASAYVWCGVTGFPRASLVTSLRGNIGVQIPTGQISMNMGNYRNALTAGVVAGAEELVNIVSGGE